MESFNFERLVGALVHAAVIAIISGVLGVILKLGWLYVVGIALPAGYLVTAVALHFGFQRRSQRSVVEPKGRSG